jgi:hypothetical protein
LKRIEKICKDDLSKEAFLEKTPSRKLIFRLEEAGANEVMKIENGALILRHNRFGLWMKYFSDFDIEKIL